MVDRVRRRDAETNRSRIIDAARAALEADPEVTMHAVARAAAVGQATLYRHFPSREALVMAVHRTDVRALVDSAPVLLQEHPPVTALRAWLGRLAQYGRIKQGLSSALHSAGYAELADEGYQPVVDAIATLLRAGVETGAVRPDVRADEVLLMAGFLWRIDLDDGWEERSTRMLDLLVDALTTRA